MIQLFGPKMLLQQTKLTYQNRDVQIVKRKRKATGDRAIKETVIVLEPPTDVFQQWIEVAITISCTCLLVGRLSRVCLDGRRSK